MAHPEGLRIHNARERKKVHGSKFICQNEAHISASVLLLSHLAKCLE